MAAADLTAARLRELLHYDPATGVFTNRAKRGHVQIGAAAGTIHPISGYRIIRIDGANYRAARLAFLYMTGHWPAGQADHIDGARLNDRWGNLRDVSQAINLQNKFKCRSDSRFGLTGVRALGSADRFGAAIKVDGVRHWLGTFDTPEAAHAAYLEAKKRLHPQSLIAISHSDTHE